MRSRSVWLGLAALLLCSAGFVLALRASSEMALAPLREPSCAALRVLDRHGSLLRNVAATCEPRRSQSKLPLAQVPQLLRDAVLVSEDRRFEQHAGVDLPAALRALFDNARAGGVVSGASTITMQLMRMLHHAGQARSLANKLSEAWLALAAEQGASKAELLEAYLSYAYNGRGAYGVSDAAFTYFGKTPAALSDAEASLLAVLPRAPSTYDPVTHLSAALQRRRVVLQQLVAAGRLTRARAEQIQAQALSVLPRRPDQPSEAPHFVDWVLQELSPEQKRAGGDLVTTLDLALQRKLQPLLAAHVSRLQLHGVTQAGVVVLDTQSSEVLAMLGSVDYAQSQLNVAVRRRHPGSLLKPFVYALAIEAGRRPGSVAFDIGDVPSDFHTRDWIGNEGGVLSMSKALAGSYNLAAVHTLEEVGVSTLRDRLRKLGVGELSQTPEHYGLQLALGSARVRLLDVTAGFGFMVRGGLVRRARALREPTLVEQTAEQRAFSPQVSWLLMEMLSNPSNRHGRFGLGLPVEGAEPMGASTRVVAKTGTASGMSDMTAVLATREVLVGAWAGRFDGTAARGTSGMWSAAPLARVALDAALAGRSPSLPDRPEGVKVETLCAVSGLLAQPACPETRQSYTLSSAEPTPTCTWHTEHDARLHAPAELAGWLARTRGYGPRLDLYPR